MEILASNRNINESDLFGPDWNDIQIVLNPLVVSIVSNLVCC